jgi:myo-inositol-1(or 4)-monophosphatase
MRLNSPQINLITRACMKASRSLIRDFGEIENLQVSTKGPGDFVHLLIKELKKF